jgi:hypothetical protein
MCLIRQGLFEIRSLVRGVPFRYGRANPIWLWEKCSTLEFRHRSPIGNFVVSPFFATLVTANGGWP